MSEDGPDPEDVIEPEETPEEGDETTPEEGEDATAEEGSEDDIPALDDDEKADIPGDLAAKMKETRDDPPESEDENGGDDPEEDPHDGGSKADEEGGSEGSDGGSEASSEYKYGDVYVDTLAIFLLEMSAELNESGETEMTEEDVRDLATSGPIDVSEAAGEVIDESGIGNEMTPGQALVTGTGMMAFAVLMKETDAAGEIVGRLSEGLEGAELGGAA